LRRSLLRPFRSNCPKALLPSRFAPPPKPESFRDVAFRSVRIVSRRSSLRTVPAEPPESASSVAACSARPARKPPWHRVRSARFDPKVHQSFAGRSSGPGAILRRVSAVRPPAAYEDSCRSIHLRFRCLVALPFSPVARFDERRSAATHGHSAQRLPVHVRSSDAWSGRRAFTLHSDTAALPSKPRNRLSSPCGSAAPLEDQVLEISSDFSVNRSRSRCHDAVTKAESHQARKRESSLWITWITCTSRR